MTYGFILRGSLPVPGFAAESVIPLSGSLLSLQVTMPPAGVAAGEVGLVGLVAVAAFLLWIRWTCFGLETASD